MSRLIAANEVLDGGVLQQVFLEDPFQSGLIDMVIADAFRVNHDDRPFFADPQTVGDGAFGVVIVLRVVEAMLLDQIGQALFELFALVRGRAVAPHTDQDAPASAGGKRV